jgi:hypothetical protein
MLRQIASILILPVNVVLVVPGVLLNLCRRRAHNRLFPEEDYRLNR